MRHTGRVLAIINILAVFCTLLHITWSYAPLSCVIGRYLYWSRWLMQNDSPGNVHGPRHVYLYTRWHVANIRMDNNQARLWGLYTYIYLSHHVLFPSIGLTLNSMLHMFVLFSPIALKTDDCVFITDARLAKSGNRNLEHRRQYLCVVPDLKIFSPALHMSR